MFLANSINILCICAVLSSTFSGIQNVGATCFDELHTDDTLNCTTYCIEKFYDKLYCKAAEQASTNLSSIIANSSATVLSHDFFASDVKKQLLVMKSKPARCINSMDGKTSYYRPEELLSLLDEKPKDRQSIEKLQGNLRERFDEKTKWCIELLQLDELVKSNLKLENTIASSDSPIVGNTENNTTIEHTTLEQVQAETSTPSMKMESTSARQTVDPPQKKRPEPRPDHHYSTALVYISSILAAITLVLVICTGFACYLSKRRKRLSFYNNASTIPLELTPLPERAADTIIYDDQ